MYMHVLHNCEKVYVTFACHDLAKYMKGREVAQSCPTLCNSMGLPRSSVHGIFQTRVLEWVVISFSRKYMKAPDKSSFN